MIQRRMGVAGPADYRRTNHAAMHLVTKPTVEPIATDEMMAYARITSVTETPVIERLVSAARERLESFLRRALITQTWDLILDWGPSWIELPWPPLQSVTGIYVRAMDYSEVLVDPTTYYVNTPARMVGLLPAKVWPPHLTPMGFRVRFVAGYGDDRADVPNSIVSTLENMVVYAYETRENINEVPESDEKGLSSYRILGAPWRMAHGLEPPELLA